MREEYISKIVKTRNYYVHGENIFSDIEKLIWLDMMLVMDNKYLIINNFENMLNYDYVEEN